MGGKRRGEANTKKPPRDDWCTPKPIVKLFHELWPEGIALDPCSNPRSIVGADVSIMLDDWMAFDLAKFPKVLFGDGKAMPWVDRTYNNPPYGRKPNVEWAVKNWTEAHTGLQVGALVPAAPGTKWFRYYWEDSAICFITGRLAFIGAPLDKYGRPSKADFESAVVYWGPKMGLFQELAGAIGTVVQWNPKPWIIPARTAAMNSTIGQGC